MTNIFFENEIVKENDLFFLCYMIERVARRLKRQNQYIVNHISKEEWMRLISLAGALHCENPLKIEDEWIEDYQLEEGNFDIKAVNPDLVDHNPTETQMGRVYTRLIVDTLLPGENYVDGMIRVYNDTICGILDDYNCGAFYEPSYVIARAYIEGGF